MWPSFVVSREILRGREKTIKHCIIIIKHTQTHQLVCMEHGIKDLDGAMRRPAILEPYLFAGNRELGWHWGQRHAPPFAELLLCTRPRALPRITQSESRIIICCFRCRNQDQVDHIRRDTHQKGHQVHTSEGTELGFELSLTPKSIVPP